MELVEQHRLEEDDDDGLKGFGGAPCFVNKSIARLHDFYLVGNIREPEHYVQWFDIIRRAGENDVIIIHINSPGGNAFTALQLIRAMNDSQAKIITSVEGICASAATMIFLSAQRHEVSAHCMFMFHNYSGMSMGKGDEMFAQVVAAKTWSTKLLHDVYKDFLTPVEIDSLLDNKDMYMDSDEVIRRLKVKFDAINAREQPEKKQPAPLEPTVNLRPKTRKKKIKSDGTPGIQEPPSIK